MITSDNQAVQLMRGLTIRLITAETHFAAAAAASGVHYTRRNHRRSSTAAEKALSTLLS